MLSAVLALLGLLAATPVVGPEIFVDPTVTSRPGTGLSPTIAFASGQYLVVWRGAGRPGGTHALRVGAGGEVVDVLPIAIDDAPQNGSSPVIGTDGRDFIVLHDYRCTPISAAGVKGASAFVLDAYPLAASFQGSEYRALYTDIVGNVSTITLDASCRTTSPATPIRVEGATIIASTPAAVGVNRAGLQLFAWKTSAEEGFHVIAIRPDGTTSPPKSFPVGLPQSITSDGSDFLVTIYDQRRQHAGAVRIDEQGVPIDLVPFDIGADLGVPIATAFAGGAYSVFVTARNGLDHVRVSPAMATFETLPGPSLACRAIGSDGARILMIANHDSASDPALDVALIEPSGSIGAARGLFRRTAAQSVASAAGDGGDLLVTWDEVSAISDVCDRKIMRFDPAGAPRWAEPTFLPLGNVQCASGAGARVDRITVAPRATLVAAEGRGAMRVDRAGHLLDDQPFVSGRSCVFDGQAFRCLLASGSLSSFPETGPVSALSEPRATGLESLTASPDGLLFATFSEEECTAMMGKIPPTCMIVTRWGLGRSSLSRLAPPRASWPGNGWFVFWNGGAFVVVSGLYGPELFADSVSPEAGVRTATLAHAPEGLTGRTAVGEGPAAFLAWQKGSDVVGSRVAPSGALETPAGVLIAAGARLEDTATSPGGRATVVYSRFVEEAPYRTLRVAFRMISELGPDPDAGVAPHDDATAKDAGVAVLLDAGSPPGLAVESCGCATSSPSSALAWIAVFSACAGTRRRRSRGSPSSGSPTS